jgi:hypothetical protein
MFTVPPVALNFLSQGLNPVLLTLSEWSPGATSISEGVLPTKLPSTSISAALGVDAMDSLAVDAGDAVDAADAGDAVDAGDVGDAADTGGWLAVPVNGFVDVVADVEGVVFGSA